MFTGIKNREHIETTALRGDALAILEAGYRAIDTEEAIHQNVRVQSGELEVMGKSVSLEGIERIHLIGFGKASCEASAALESVLGDRLASGVAIDVETGTCEVVTSYQASHPKPTEQNVSASQHVVDLAESLTEHDLVIVAVSGGGSALLCWPMSECEQGQKLYEQFLSAGGTIQELNTVRKHLSGLKGGGLIEKLHPAQVVGLIFSDVPGGELSDVASGPTFYDETTVSDAKAILTKYNIDAEFELTETPKDTALFERVTNIGLVTNSVGLTAMKNTAEELGYSSEVISTKMYDFAVPTIEQFWDRAEANTVLLGGGEIRLVVEGGGGSGGRNLYLANEALRHIRDDSELFIAAASDGIDNCESAGGIADTDTLKRIAVQGLSLEEYLADFDSYRLFNQTGDAIITGSTGANVADILMYIKQ